MREVNLGGSMEVGKKVAVIGGGNSAIDAARTACRMGAEEVKIYYRRLREDMPAMDEEIEGALEEGVVIEFLKAPAGIVGKNGSVVGMEIQEMDLGDFDSSGRRRPVPKENGRYVVDVDTVIAAIGQEPNLSVFADGGNPAVTGKKGKIEVMKSYRTKLEHPGFFAGGDAVTGPATVVEAIRAGQDAAEEIDGYIRENNGEPPYQPPKEDAIDIPVEIDEDTVETPCFLTKHLPASDRRENFEEVDTGFARDDALAEAGRCLRCDVEIE